MKNFDVFYLDEKTASVELGERKVRVKRQVIHPAKQIFAKDEMSRYEFGEVLRLRCWDEHRQNLDRYLKKLGLREFDVYKICEKTHGVRIGEPIWFRFEGETLCASDVLGPW